MLKKITLFLLLNASLMLGVVTLQNSQQSHEHKTQKTMRAKTAKAISSYPFGDSSSQPKINPESVKKLKNWHQRYAQELKLPLRWEKDFEKAVKHKKFAAPRSESLLKELTKEVEQMQALSLKHGKKDLNQETKKMAKVLESTDFYLKSDELSSTLNDYVSIILNSNFSTESKQLALKEAADVEKVLVEYQGVAKDLKQEQIWAQTFSDLPRKMNSNTTHFIPDNQDHFYFSAQLILYGLFFVLNFLLLWDWGRKKKSFAKATTKKKSFALDGLLCSRSAIEKSLVKSKKILKGQAPDFQIREWESHNILFTNRMRDSLAEIFAEIALHSGLKTRLSLEANEEKKVSCQLICSYLSEVKNEDSSFFDSLSRRTKELADELKIYKGELNWECLYNENGPYEVCLSIELPHAPV